MRKSAVTAQQVARRAGVSQTTVSFVLNNVESANISEATRARVLQAARELGYVPAAAARTLARGVSSTLGLVLFRPHRQVFSDPYVPNVLTGFSEVCKQHGYRILVEHLNDFEDTTALANLLRGGEVAGALISGWNAGHHDLLYPLVQDGYPIVCLDALSDLVIPIPYVIIDHVNGVRAAIRHLIALGHRAIGCIPYAPSTTHIELRLNAYRETLEAHGIPYDPRRIRYGAYEPESGREAALALLDEHPTLTAIFGMNDLMALGAMQAARLRGRRIPDDLAVVGYDDMRFAAFTAPPLTTVHAPEIEVGQRAGAMLLELLKTKHAALPAQQLHTELIVRESCGGGKDR